MRDDEGRIDLALFDPLEEDRQIVLHRRLRHAEGETTVHRRAHRNLVEKAAVYADGGVNLRLSAATDALAVHLSQRADVALAYLATPTDVFVVPGDAVAQANSRLDSAFLRTVRRPLRVLSGGRLLQRQYPPGPAAASLSDTIVPQQGPNYLLAKRLHRWLQGLYRQLNCNA